MRILFSYVCLLVFMHGPAWAREWVILNTTLLLDLRRVLLEQGNYEAAAKCFDEARRRGLL